MNQNRFRNVRILDNFYQTSSFFPMPVVLVCTIAESGQMNLGPYSLCFPYTVAGDKYQMVFNTRDNSNTAINLRRSGLCTLNFIPDDRRYIRNCVMLGYPGENTEEKMKNSIFTLDSSKRSVEERKLETEYPDLVDGRKSFPNLPIDYGFRNNAHFWFTKHSPPYREPIPRSKATSVDSVVWAITRGGFAEDLEWSEEAAARLVGIPRVFLSVALRGIVEEAKSAGVSVITGEFLDTIRDKRAREKDR